MKKTKSKTLMIYLSIILIFMDIILVIFIFNGLLFTEEKLWSVKTSFQVTNEIVPTLRKIVIPDSSISLESMVTDKPFYKKELFLEYLKQIIGNSSEHEDIILKVSEQTNITFSYLILLLAILICFIIMTFISIINFYGTKDIKYYYRRISTLFSSNSKKIRVVCYGIGGSGKTTFYNKFFKNDSEKTKKTERVFEYNVVQSYKENNINFSILDYAGQKEREIREKLRQLNDDEEEIDVILFFLSFFDTSKESNDLIIPDSKEERLKAIRKNSELQSERLNTPIIDEIITYCNNAHTIYIIINQIDAIKDINYLSRRKFSQQTFKKIISKINNVVEELKKPTPKNGDIQAARDIQVFVKFISAIEGTEISNLNYRKTKLNIVEQIIERCENKKWVTKDQN